MPPVLVAAALYAAKVITIGTFLLTTIAYGITAYQQKRARDKARAAYNAKLQDRLVMTATVDRARSRCYGRVRNVDGILFKATRGEKKQYYTLIVALAGHKVAALEAVYFNDKVVALDGAGYVTTAPWNGATTDQAAASIPPGEDSVILPVAPKAGSVQMVVQSGEGDTVVTPVVAGLEVGSGGLYNGFKRDFVYQSDKTSSKARVRFYNGGDGQDLSTELASDFPGLITPGAHRFEGIALLRVDLEYDQDAFANGVPNISARLRGAEVYDPRTGTTAWSENPALIARDWALYSAGGGCSTADLWEPSFIAAANACDVTHGFVSKDLAGGAATTTTRPMYTCNIVCDTAASPMDTLAEIVESMAGAYAWPGGRLRVRAGAYTAPVATITGDWLSDQGTIDMVKDAPRNDLVNVITPVIADVAKDYVAAPMPRIVAQAYVDIDGQEYPREDEYTAITDADHAAHVAGVSLRYARLATVYTLPCNMRALPLELFDTVTVNLPEIGLDGALMEVIGWGFDMSKALVTLTVKATAASIYDPDAEFKREDALPNSALPNPWAVPDVGELELESGTAHLLKQADGTIVSRVLVSWPAVQDQAVLDGGQVELRYGPPSVDPVAWQVLLVPGRDTQAYLTGVQDGRAYAVIARCRNKLVRGRWTLPKLHVVQGKTQAPADVTGLAFMSMPGGVDVTWDASTELDYGYTELRRGSSWAAGTLVWRGKASSYNWPIIPGSYQLWAKHVDTSGNESITAAPLAVEAVAVYGKSLRLSTSATVIKIGKTGIVDPTSVTLTATGAGLTGAPYFYVSGGTATLSGTGTTRLLTEAAMVTDVVTIACHWDGLDDVVTVTKVRDGTDGAGSGSANFNMVLFGAAVADSANSVRKTGTTTGADAGGYSVESYIGGAQVSCQPTSSCGGGDVVGLATSTGGSPSLRWIFYRPEDGGGYDAYAASGGSVLGTTTWSPTDGFSVVYDGGQTKWFKNGTLVATQAASASQQFYLKVILNRPTSKVVNLAFSGSVTGTIIRNYRQESDPGAVPDGSTWTVPSTGRSYIRQGGAWVPYVGAGAISTDEIQTQAVSSNGVTINATSVSAGSGAGDLLSAGILPGPTITLADGDLLDISLNGLHNQYVLSQYTTTRLVDMFQTEIWVQIRRGSEAAIEIGKRVRVVSPAKGPNTDTPIPIPFSAQVTPGAGAWAITAFYNVRGLNDQGQAAYRNNGFDSSAEWRIKRLKR